MKQYGSFEETTTTNQKTDFSGVQPNLQSIKNYRSNNMRLEMKFFNKSDKFKDIFRFL